MVTATGCSLPQNLNSPAVQEEEYDQAYQKAVLNLRETLSRLRVDHNNHMIDLFASHVPEKVKVEEMTSAAKIVNTTHTPEGGIEVTLEMNLYGGFAQLMLPSDIRQVETIRPLSGSGAANDSSDGNEAAKNPDRASEPDAYSGLIVDARGIGASPSMVPVLVDENNHEVYGPNFVSREFAVQHGMCRYVREPEHSYALPRVAPNPLLVKGLRAASTGSCDIVISNSDASKLRGVSSHLELLKQCRVVIIID